MARFRATWRSGCWFGWKWWLSHFSFLRSPSAQRWFSPKEVPLLSVLQRQVAWIGSIHHDVEHLQEQYALNQAYLRNTEGQIARVPELIATINCMESTITHYGIEMQRLREYMQELQNIERHSQDRFLVLERQYLINNGADTRLVGVERGLSVLSDLFRRMNNAEEQLSLIQAAQTAFGDICPENLDDVLDAIQAQYHALTEQVDALAALAVKHPPHRKATKEIPS